MNYLSIDVGGSSIKYAVINENFEFISKGTQKVNAETFDDFVGIIQKIYEEIKPDGGIAVSYCGELDEVSGLIYNGGSYHFNSGHNLKVALENACHTKVSIENDGNCGALAELHKGSLQNYNDSAVVIIGTGLGGALIFDRKIRHGANKFVGSLSFMASNINEKFSVRNMSAGSGSFHYLIDAYNKVSDTQIENGIEFFDLVNNKNETVMTILKEYCCHIANILFNLNLVLDVECIAIGGGISGQSIFQQTLNEEFDAIYHAVPIKFLNMKKPQLTICQYHNDSNLIGALCHHLDL